MKTSNVTAHHELVALERKLKRVDLSKEERDFLEQEVRALRDIWSL